MAKKKRETLSSTDDAFAALLDRVAEDSALPTPELTGDCVLAGIPIPSLAFQYLLGSNVLPLSKMLELSGFEGSFKSTLSYELIRWFLASGGRAIVIDTEMKDNSDVRNAILNWDKDYLNQVMVFSTSTFEEWATIVNKVLDTYVEVYSREAKNKEERERGIGKKTQPVLVIIDSLVASGTESEHDKAKDDGVNAGGYGADLAKAISKNFRLWPAKIRCMPIDILFTNHRKDDLKLGIQYITPGGKAPKFYASYRIACSPGSNNMNSSRPNIVVDMKTIKNSLGEGKRTVSVPIVYSSDTLSTGEVVKQIKFDWSTADVDFLTGYMAKTKAENRHKIESIIDINKVSVSRNDRYWSDRLGIPSSDPLPSWEFGTAMTNNVAVMDELQKFFEIAKHGVFEAGDDYDSVLESTRNSKRAFVQQLNTEHTGYTANLVPHEENFDSEE